MSQQKRAYFFSRVLYQSYICRALTTAPGKATSSVSQTSTKMSLLSILDVQMECPDVYVESIEKD